VSIWFPVFAGPFLLGSVPWVPDARMGGFLLAGVYLLS
jgi:hypothetical protein